MRYPLSPFPCRKKLTSVLTWILRIKDKHGNVPAEYLSAETSTTDRAIQRALAIATAEFNISIASGDIASDDEDVGGADSASDQEE